MKIVTDLKEAQLLLKQGAVIAYPTEAVFGLGCDPFNEGAVTKLLVLKQRVPHKGLILLITDWTQLFPLIGHVPDQFLEPVKESWPGPVTWLFPKSEIIPAWVSGAHKSIAIRMSAHPVAQALSSAGPLVSTSANISGQEPARSLRELDRQFPKGIEAVVEGHLGGATNPSAIYDVLTGQRLR